MNASETMLNMSMKTDSKVGYTTTVKEQVEDIEVYMIKIIEQD